MSKVFANVLINAYNHERFIEEAVITLRLATGEGSPLETFRTDLRDYDLHHPDVSLFRRFLKCFSLVPTLFLSARHYNALRRSLVSNSLYRRFRQKYFPFRQPNHVDRSDGWGL